MDLYTNKTIADSSTLVFTLLHSSLQVAPLFSSSCSTLVFRCSTVVLEVLHSCLGTAPLLPSNCSTLVLELLRSNLLLPLLHSRLGTTPFQSSLATAPLSSWNYSVPIFSCHCSTLISSPSPRVMETPYSSIVILELFLVSLGTARLLAWKCYFVLGAVSRVSGCNLSQVFLKQIRSSGCMATSPLKGTVTWDF